MVGHIFNLVLVALCSGKDAFKELSGHAGFSVEECVAGKAEQQWILSDGVVPVRARRSIYLEVITRSSIHGSRSAAIVCSA